MSKKKPKTVEGGLQGLTVVRRKLSPQNQKIFDYLKTGRSLTPLIAFTTMNIGSITKRISELKRAGYRIKSEWKTHPNGQSYTSYTLEE